MGALRSIFWEHRERSDYPCLGRVRKGFLELDLEE
jgi:hypothetical protein